MILKFWLFQCLYVSKAEHLINLSIEYLKFRFSKLKYKWLGVKISHESYLMGDWRRFWIYAKKTRNTLSSF